MLLSDRNINRYGQLLHPWQKNCKSMMIDDLSSHNTSGNIAIYQFAVSCKLITHN